MFRDYERIEFIVLVHLFLTKELYSLYRSHSVENSSHGLSTKNTERVRDRFMSTPSEEKRDNATELKSIKKLKGAEVQFECSCGERVSIPFTLLEPYSETFSIPCLCQMQYSISMERESSSITVHVLGRRDKLETIF